MGSWKAKKSLRFPNMYLLKTRLWLSVNPSVMPQGHTQSYQYCEDHLDPPYPYLHFFWLGNWFNSNYEETTVYSMDYLYLSSYPITNHGLCTISLSDFMTNSIIPLSKYFIIG